MHFSRIRTARLQTIRVSVAITKCQSHGGRYTYYPQVYLKPPPVYINPLDNYPPGKGTWYQGYLPLRRELVPEITNPPQQIDRHL